jgi:hypothetical protein
MRSSRIGATLAVVGVASGCAAASAQQPASQAPAASARTATTATAGATTRTGGAAASASPSAPLTPIARMTNVARQRYRIEVHGGVAFKTLHRIGSDPTLLRTLRSGNVSATQAYVRRQFSSVWYHWHASRMRILRGSQVVVETGVPFVVAPSQMTLRSGGRTLGTLQVSIQDEIGFVRYMNRNYPVDVVVRGQGAGHVRSSLPAATNANLPSQGRVTIGGRRYVVSSFKETAWGNEPVTVWILMKG